MISRFADLNPDVELRLPEKRLFRADEVAHALDISTDTVYRWMKKGSIESIQIGNSRKVFREELERIMREGVNLGDERDRPEIEDDSAKKYETCVYLLRAETGIYKIGLSCSLHGRMKTLHDSSPVDLTLVGILIVNNHHKLENELHLKYAEQRKRGEWFALTDNQVEEIRSRSEFRSLNLSVSEYLKICL